jgi:hypothetical protein
MTDPTMSDAERQDIVDEANLIAVMDRLITCIKEAQQAIADLQSGS